MSHADSGQPSATSTDLPYVCISFYKFVALTGLQEMQRNLRALSGQGRVMGNIILASEGINCQAAGLQSDVDLFVDGVRRYPELVDIQPKVSNARTNVFYRMKITIKEEIVKLGAPAPTIERTGEHVDPREWNALLQDPDVLVVDTRNEDEICVGTFRNAVDPQTQTFTEFPQYVDSLEGMQDRKIAMFCTGGVRCEKASAYMLQRGFKHVYQLHGGVLKYFENVPAEESMWDGELFVFDTRVAVKHGPSGVEPGSTRRCYACRASLSLDDQASPLYRCGVSCPHCHGKLTPEQLQGRAMRQQQIELAQKRTAMASSHVHIGLLARLNAHRPTTPRRPECSAEPATV
eukprot:GGOE01013765.1.p1 GENE.GGOE01013765.1~~GGOE01013765.1.p1  ORF type:complete len:369 (-),score=76.57 GGOE01013765.1:148-1188(-)